MTREGRPARRPDALRHISRHTTAASVPRQPRNGEDRRRQASYRLPPMECGHRDPLDCLAGHPHRLTPGEIEAWQAAAAHLRAHGLEPLAPAWVMAQLRGAAA